MSAPLPVVYITDSLADQTAELLHSFATKVPSEGVVYWFGIETSRIAVVTTLIVPDADTSYGRVRTTAESNAEAIAIAIDTPLVYLGQAHSHPTSHVSHSDVDDTETFARFEGALSIVVPWFGRYGFNLEECGVHRHVSGRFELVPDVHRHIKVIPGFADLRHSIRVDS